MPQFNTFKFGQEKFGEKPPRYAHLPTLAQHTLGARARKKLGGKIIYHVRYGKQEQYKYTTPTNPQTEDQQANRSKFATAVAAWQALSEDQKSAWRKKALGSTIPGYQFFLRKEMEK